MKAMALRTALIGHTGFIGSNLARQVAFDRHYNSKNIKEIREQKFDLLVCGGITATKWWANQNPVEDMARIQALLSELAFVQAKKVVVLSTIDVYPVNHGVDESFDCGTIPNHAYGTNRLRFEERMRDLFADVLVVRISGVFGPGLKKNVIYDLLNNNCLDVINPESRFQYYNVNHLWRDLKKLDHGGVNLINFVTEPIRTGDIINRFFPGKRVGDKCGPAVHYDVCTMHRGLFGGPPGYLMAREEVMGELAAFVSGDPAGVPAQ